MPPQANGDLVHTAVKTNMDEQSVLMSEAVCILRKNVLFSREHDSQWLQYNRTIE